METEQAHAELDEAKEEMAGRWDVLELLHQWIIGTGGGKSVPAGDSLVSAEEYFLHQIRRERVPGHRCAVCVMEENTQDGTPGSTE